MEIHLKNSIINFNQILEGIGLWFFMLHLQLFITIKC